MISFKSNVCLFLQPIVKTSLSLLLGFVIYNPAQAQSAAKASSHTQSTSIALVIGISGQANLIVPNKKTGENISRLILGAELQEGSRVSTGANSFATLLLEDGSRLSIPSNSQIELSKLRVAQAPSIENPQALAPVHEIKLIKGSVETRVTPITNTAGRFVLRSPHSVAGVRGTVFRARIDESGTAVATEVLEGAVQVDGAQPQSSEAKTGALVPAGSGLFAHAGGHVDAPTPLLPQPHFQHGLARQESRDLQVAIETMPHANRYHYQLATDSEFNVILSEQLTPSTTFQVKSLQNGEYFVRATALDGKGLEGMPSVATVRLITQPVAPAIATAKSRTRQSVVQLDWTAVAQATGYQVQLVNLGSHSTTIDAISAEALQSVIDLPPVTHNHINTPPLKSGNYAWRVASIGHARRNSTNSSIERGPYSLFSQLTIAPLTPPITPKVSVTRADELHFEWMGEAGLHYLFELAADANFQNMLYTLGTQVTQVRIPAPSAGTYYTRLRITETDGEVGEFSQALRFNLINQSAPLIGQMFDEALSTKAIAF